MQIRNISLSKLDKASMLPIMSNIIGILKEYDVEKLHLDYMMKILEKNQLQVNTISKLKGSLSLTVDVEKWHDERISICWIYCHSNKELFEQIEMGHRNYSELNYVPLMTRLM